MTETGNVHLLTPGRIVRLRERLWRVDYRDGSVFGATALDGRDNRPTRFHADLEHVESGELPFPDPNAIGDERQQRLLLDAYRFSLLHGTAPILGLQRSRAILQTSRSSRCSWPSGRTEYGC
jgi:hypothetical protein